MKITNFKFIKIKKIDVPFIVLLIVISTFVATAGESSVFGRTIAGWAWFIPFLICLIIISLRFSYITFRIVLWLPWICVVIAYLIKSDFSYLQRNIMLLCPIVVGMAVSSYRIREAQIRSLLTLITVLMYSLFVTVIIRTGLLFTGALPPVTGLAPQGITAALLCTIFAVGYTVKRNENLFNWIMGVTIPVIALTRTAIIATLLTVPLTLASLGIKKRLLFLMAIIAIAVSLFYTERVQNKMFFSGRGEIQDLRFGNPDLFTAGRSYIWDIMIEEIKSKPTWGHGANASEELVFSLTFGALTHPHNDWLRLLYDYGFIGTAAFAFCLVAQIIHLLRNAKRVFGNLRILLYAGASSFLPFILLMFTDNIILYAAFFGNLQFTILGLVYAAQKTQEIDTWYYFKKLSIADKENISNMASVRHPLNFHHPESRSFHGKLGGKLNIWTKH